MHTCAAYLLCVVECTNFNIPLRIVSRGGSLVQQQMLVVQPVREVLPESQHPLLPEFRDGFSVRSEAHHCLFPEFRLYAEAIRALATPDTELWTMCGAVVADDVCLLTSHYFFQQGGLYIHDFAQPEAFEGTWELDLLEAVSLRQVIIHWNKEFGKKRTVWNTHELMRSAFLVNNDGFLSLRFPMELFLCASLASRLFLVSTQPVLHIRCHQNTDRIRQFPNAGIRLLQLQSGPPCMGFPGLIAKRLSPDLNPCGSGKIVNYYQLCEDAWLCMREAVETRKHLKGHEKAVVDEASNRLLQAFRTYPSQACTSATDGSLLYIQEATSLPAEDDRYWHLGSLFLELGSMETPGPRLIEFWPWQRFVRSNENEWVHAQIWDDDCTVTDVWVAPELAGGGPLKIHPRFIQLYPVHENQLDQPMMQHVDTRDAWQKNTGALPAWHLCRAGGDPLSVSYLISSRLMLSCKRQSSQDDMALVATHTRFQPQFQCSLPAHLPVINMLHHVLMRMLQANKSEYFTYTHMLYHVIRGNIIHPDEEALFQDSGGAREDHTLVTMSDRMLLSIDPDGTVTLYGIGSWSLSVRVRGPEALQGRISLWTDRGSAAAVYEYDFIQSSPESCRTIGGQLRAVFTHWVMQERLPTDSFRVVEMLSERFGVINVPSDKAVTPALQNPCWLKWRNRLAVGEAMIVRRLCDCLRDDAIFICDGMTGLAAKDIMLERSAKGVHRLSYNSIHLHELCLHQPAAETRAIAVTDVCSTFYPQSPMCCVVLPRRSIHMYLLPSVSNAVSFLAIHTGGDVVKEAIITIGNSASTGATVMPIEDDKTPLLPAASARREGGGGKASAPSESTRPVMPVLVAAEEQLDSAAWETVPTTPKKILQLTNAEEAKRHQLALAASVIAAYLAQQGGSVQSQTDTEWREAETGSEGDVLEVPEVHLDDIIAGTAHTGLRRRRKPDESACAVRHESAPASAASGSFHQVLRACCQSGAGPELHPVPFCFAEFESRPNDAHTHYTHLRSRQRQALKLRAKRLTATRFWYMYKFVNGNSLWWLLIPRVPSETRVAALDTAVAFHSAAFTYELGKMSVCAEWEHDESAVLESCGTGLHYCFKWSTCTHFVSAKIPVKDSDRVFVFDLEPDGQWRIHEKLFFDL